MYISACLSTSQHVRLVQFDISSSGSPTTSATYLNRCHASLPAVTARCHCQVSQSLKLNATSATSCTDAFQVSADQRARLLSNTARLNESSERIQSGKRQLMETEELGVSILQDLHKQREVLLHTRETVRS